MDDNSVSFAYKFLSSAISDLFIVFDFYQNKIIHVSNNGLILCGIKEKIHDFDYLKKIIHPNDRYFLKDVYNIIQNSFYHNELSIDKIDYFSFLLRINNCLSSNEKSNYIMTYVKLKLHWENEQFRYGFCLLSASAIREQSNRLLAYYDNMNYSNYSFRTKKWEYFPFSPLTIRQKEMLIWTQHGFSLKETATKMNLSDKTIENIRSLLFEKFGVNSIEQAIQYASNRKLIDCFSFSEE